MSGLGPRFDPSELADTSGPLPDADAAGLLATARELEEFARTEFVMPTVGFEDRVMAAVAAEAPPHLVASGRFLPGLIAAVRDAWRITWSSGRPIAVRAQAFALVLLVVVTVGSTGSLVVVGAASLLSGDDATPTPIVDTSLPPVSPSPSAAPVPTPSPSPSVSPSPSPSQSPEPSETPDAPESAEPTSTSGPGATQAPTRTPPPTARPTPTPTPQPTTTPDSTDSPAPTGTDDSSESPRPTDTPDPTETP